MNGLWSRFVEYFSVEVVGDDPLPTNRSALYAVIPHGTFPFGVGVVSFYSNKYHQRPGSILYAAIAK